TVPLDRGPLRVVEVGLHRRLHIAKSFARRRRLDLRHIHRSPGELFEHAVHVEHVLHDPECRPLGARRRRVPTFVGHLTHEGGEVLGQLAIAVGGFRHGANSVTPPSHRSPSHRWIVVDDTLTAWAKALRTTLIASVSSSAPASSRPPRSTTAPVRRIP